jgi:hypothetical protein
VYGSKILCLFAEIFLTLAWKSSHDSLKKFILDAIFFILVGNIKYGDDIFFILGENICKKCDVGKVSVKCEDGGGEGRRKSR